MHTPSGYCSSPGGNVSCSCVLFAYILLQVYTWGCNDEGALGRITRDGEEYSPGLVEFINKDKIVHVSAGKDLRSFLRDESVSLNFLPTR